MNKKISLFFFLTILTLFFCCSNYKTKQYTSQTTGIGIKNDNTVIVRVGYYLFDRVPGNFGPNDNEEDYSVYLLEKNIGQNNLTVKGGDNIAGDKEIVCHNNVIGVGGSVQLSGGYNGVLLLSGDNYQILKTVNLSLGSFHDFTNDLNKILFNNMEYDITTTTSTPILPPYPVLDAKYCPTNNALIAYVGETFTAGNMQGDLYTINNDGTNMTDILSGYNINNIYWNPNGNTIVFINNTGIWNVNKDGTGLSEIMAYSLPQGYKYFALYYDLLAYVDVNDVVQTIKF